MKKLLFLLISAIICHFQSIAQSENLPDLNFEKAVKSSTKNIPIELEITVKNIGKVISEPTILSVDANYNCVVESDIERLNLTLVNSDFFYQVYRITKNIPALKPKETAVFEIKLDSHYSSDCSFYIKIDRENQLQEKNENNNVAVFPSARANEFGVVSDLIVQKIHQPTFKNDSTFVTVDMENIGFDVAENVTLAVWEITETMPHVSERDLKALLGKNWWLFTEKEAFEPMFDFSKTIGNISAGEKVSVTVSFKGWVYNPDCKIGVEVKTTSVEKTKDNNSSSFLAGG